MAVHMRAAEAAKFGQMTQRAEIMLGLVLDVKNNRRSKGNVLSVQISPSVAKWLRQTGVATVKLRTVSWAILLAPKKKVCRVLIFVLSEALSASMSLY